ncbi:MAG: hypothetical protein WBH75_06280 [Thermoanaerobaculia bacterium]
MRRSTILVVGLLVLGALALSTPSAWAIPAFARKNNLACSSCHSAVPYLNSTGRTFKETGFILPDEDGEIDFDAQPGNQKISNSLIFDKVYPISARIKGYIVDDQEGSDTKIRPIHEIEIFSAGNFWKKGSWFWELEGEDEEDFEIGVGGNFAWHQNRQLNFQLGFGSIFHPDPYNSLQDGGHRLTVSHKIPLDVGKSVDARFRKGAQYLALYGRSKDFFYLLSYSAGNGNPEGENPKDFLGRVAYDFTPDLMVGAFYYGGERDDGFVDLTRWGIDWNLAFSNFYIDGMFMESEEDFANIPVGEEFVPIPDQKNTAGFLELFYTHRRDGRPFIVPLLRYGFTELNDGADRVAVVTAQLGFYVIENMKLALEVSTETDQVPGEEKLSRFTLLADLAF